jgi:hypothetical protein
LEKYISLNQCKASNPLPPVIGSSAFARRLSGLDLCGFSVPYLNGLTSSLSRLADLNNEDGNIPRGRWIYVVVGRTDFKVNIVAYPQTKSLCVQLVIFGNNSIADLRKLKDLYAAEVRATLSSDIQWVENEAGEEQYIKYYIKNTNPMDKSDWANQHQELLNWVQKLVNYFKDKVREL